MTPPRSLVCSSVAAALVLLPSCSGVSRGAPPPQAPGLESPHTPVETSDGEVVGADRTSPADKLATSPRVGSEGALPAAQPGKPERRKPPAKPAAKPPPR